MTDKIYQKLENIKGESTAHLSGLKRVFLSNDETQSKVTQFAYGLFSPGEKCLAHKHETMEEMFFFIKGSGQYLVGEEIISIEPGLFLRIPANTVHELHNNGNEALEFVYFGVAID